MVQSPAFIPKPLINVSETNYKNFLAAANVTTISQLRNLSDSVLMAANKVVQSTGFYGTFPLGPTPDGEYIIDLPGKRLLSGQFNKNVSVLAAHNSNEANKYTDPATNGTSFTTYMNLYFPTMSSSDLSYLEKILYPAEYNGSQPYTTAFSRLDLAISDFTFTCATAWLAKAYKNATYNYLFSVAPGNHTEDVPYTYHNGPISTVKNSTLATMLQSYLTNFAAKKDPNGVGLPTWEKYGNANVLNLNTTVVHSIVDETANKRCEWWQLAKYGDDYPLTTGVNRARVWFVVDTT